MKMYDYLIAYKCNREGYIGPFDGSACVSRKKKIKTLEDIKEVVEFITSQTEGTSNVGIYNVILLGRNKH